MERTLKISLLLLVAVCMSFSVQGQTPTVYSAKLTPELLRSDFQEMRDSLQILHPGLYRYRSKAEMDKIFQQAYQQIDHPMPETAFYMLVSKVISKIEDGHTECFLPQDFIGMIIGSVKIFPIQPRFIGDRAYIPCDTKEFSAGTEITTIDGKPINEIRKKLFGLLSSDGRIRTGKYVKINDGHDPFSYLYLVAFGEKATFKVGYIDAKGRPAEKTIDAQLFEQMECQPIEPKIDKYLTLECRTDGVAVMTLKTFANEYLENTKEDFPAFLAASFKELKGKNIHKLIIDLRDNGGGEDSNGLLLYRYLSIQPFTYYASLNTTKRSITDHPNLQLQQPEPNNFKGIAEFLISGKSFSGAAEFSAVARDHNRGAFIGEETAGGYIGNTSGGKVTLILSNTKIRVNIPTTKYVMAVKAGRYKDRGIIPDYTIIPTIGDYLQHKDVQMDFALKLLTKYKSK